MREKHDVPFSPIFFVALTYRSRILLRGFYERLVSSFTR